MNKHIISDAFLCDAAGTLGDTDNGLTGSEICNYLVRYATKYNRDIPFVKYPFKKGDGTSSVNKRTALQSNLKSFSCTEQYIIIRELCNLEKFNNNENVKTLKLKLLKDYKNFAPVVEIEEVFIEETSHWLKEYSNAFRHYNDAYHKYKSEDEQLYRNTLDDARLALEELIREILGNNKSIENQKEEIGKFIEERNGTKEFFNMFWKLLNHYSTYQNNRVKHHENIIENEIAFIFELTTIFMRQLVRLNS